MLILASQSPRRRDLLQRTKLNFCVLSRPAKEENHAALPPEQLCARNAFAKAEAVAKDFHDHTIIGADTLVFLDGKPLGKPTDMADAHRMLAELQGRTHSVCTAVAILFPNGKRRDFAVTSHVTFRSMSESDIDRYLAEVPVLDKAGAYAMQEKSELIVADVQGDIDNVIGLPVTRLLQELTA